MAAASVTPPGSLDLLQPGFSKTLLGTKLEDKYLCSACRNVLRRPFQAQCGHRYCSYCLSNILSSGPQNCAACVHEGIYEEGVSILESSSAFPDNAARREVESLPAVCPSDGCTWKGTLKEYESCHEGHCPFVLTECPACKGLVRLGEKERHLGQECPERSLSCRHCRAPCCSANMKAHLQVCPKFPLTCDGCGKKKISREKFQDHVRTCGRCRVPCRFHAVGCPEMVESEKQQEHEAQRLREHLGLLLGVFLEARPSPGGGGQPFLGQSEGSWEGGGPGLGPSKAAELLQRCEALERKTATFENIVCVLNREVERVAMTAEACGRQHRLDQDRIEALSNKVQQLERSIGLKDLAVADLEQKVQELQASTFDGVFIWKISDFARKRQEAVAGRAPAIFSPAFYTSRHRAVLVRPSNLQGEWCLLAPGLAAGVASCPPGLAVCDPRSLSSAGPPTRRARSCSCGPPPPLFWSSVCRAAPSRPLPLRAGPRGVPILAGPQVWKNGRWLRLCLGL
uniref:TNF receptor associated factor 2 n=1 Tax=Sus scrofa TaxID=9823 RepID=A0A8D1MEX8_PIG